MEVVEQTISYIDDLHRYKHRHKWPVASWHIVHLSVLALGKLKGQCHELNIFEGLNILSVISALMVFKVFPTAFHFLIK
jgi:hypothetical protein